MFSLSSLVDYSLLDRISYIREIRMYFGKLYVASTVLNYEQDK